MKHIPPKCTKIGYVSRREAGLALKNHNRRSSKNTHGMGGLNVYKCQVPGCSQWHLGRKPKQRRG